ncbi:probable serine carboxypeptidase CPVL [Dermacentor andersoni]|uniref:probable serine carboxypeptidase CPVL n=1 Tax=Dermacentor andersoni TaxID=34620 RepID=UPI002417D99A|nr:probable serine carboxypeptidase CPVL [Dermacentor andersoni]
MKLYRATTVFLISALAWTRCMSGGGTKIQGALPQQTMDFGDLLLPATNDRIPEEKLREMRNASRVVLPAPCAKVEAYSGFIPVDTANASTHSTYLFFLHLKSQANSNMKPLLLWLQGGPGMSGLFGQFLENGPLGIDAGGTLYRRRHSLLSKFNIIYLDAPVGSGYSFDKTGKYPTTLEEAAVHTVRFLRRFLRIFPEYKGREFFAAGESYGARSAIGVAHELLTRPPPELHLRLKGVMLGVGFVFPLLEIINSADYLYCSGLLDEHGRTTFTRQFQKIQGLVSAGNVTAAAGLLGQTVLNIHPGGTKSLFEELTGFQHHGSVVRFRTSRESEQYMQYANSPEFKNLIHVAPSRTLGATRSQVAMSLAVGDFFVDKTQTLVDVLNRVHVLFYTAQLDAVFPATNMERSFGKLEWRGSAMFKTAVRRPWYKTGSANRELMGYEKLVGAVMYSTVLFGGHLVSFDQSAAVSDMYGRFLHFTAVGSGNVPGQKCGNGKMPC